ncbi:MAG: NAD(P)/FAD-dependent oxidoreductase [Alphaproteobacteria bacterium]
MERWDIIVVGGGAAGLVAAGAASEAGARALVCEKMSRAARKVGISGKGRANVTNDKPVEIFVEGYRQGGDFLRSAFARFFTADTIDLLQRRGVKCITERGGRVFPKSGQAGDVVKALYRYARAKGGAVRLQAKVDEINTKPDGFGLQIKEEELLARRLILATGGRSYPRTGSTGDGYRFAAALGHTIVPPRPALAPLTLGDLPRDLRVHLRNVRVTLLDGKKKIRDEFGEALLENGSLGGPVPLGFARDVPELAEPRVSLDLKPALDEAKLDARLQRDLDKNGKQALLTVLQGLLPRDLIPLFTDRLGLDTGKKCAEVGKKTRLALGALCKDLSFPVTGTSGWAEALVTAGGVALAEVDPRTMESRSVPGLYLCGELLDIDGVSGGYNLQAAFSTGYTAGVSAAESLR